MHTSHNQALSRGATPRESTGLFINVCSVCNSPFYAASDQTLNANVCQTCLDQPLPPDPPAAAIRRPDPIGSFERETRRIQETWKQVELTVFEAAGYVDEDDEQRELILEATGFFDDQRYLEGQQIAELLDGVLSSAIEPQAPGLREAA